MNPSPANLSKLLSATDVLIKQHKRVEKLKGEKFNIFSILKMERLEEKTHSRFLRELLDPKGSHLMDDTFLKLFLKSIQLENYLDTASTKVFTEKHLGYINANNQSGGRIDLLLEDKNGKCIIIENKIDANDQRGQLVRYSKYKPNNKIFYLNLFGDLPSDGSISLNSDNIQDNSGKKHLSINEDFFVISYKNEILTWLEACHKEAVNQAILRESIKQYQLLVKKITNCMANNEQEELNKIILKDVEAARYIRVNYDKVIQDIREDFRSAVIKNVKIKLDEIGINLQIKKGDVIQSTHAQVWFKIHDNDKFYFGMEPFSGNLNSFSKGELMMGICNDSDKEVKDEMYEFKSTFWMHHIMLKFDSKEIMLHDAKLIEKLALKGNYFEEIVEKITKDFVNMVKQNLEKVNKLNGRNEK